MEKKGNTTEAQLSEMRKIIEGLEAAIKKQETEQVTKVGEASKVCDDRLKEQVSKMEIIHREFSDEANELRMELDDQLKRTEEHV